MKNVIDTPFGSIHVKLNDKIIDFKYSEKIFSYQDKNLSSKIKIYLIDIDTKDMIVGDTISCGFDQPLLEYDDGDERSIVFTTKNNNVLLGLCGYEPEYYDETLRQSYSFCIDYTSDHSYGIQYVIERNPKDFDNCFYQSRVITLATCWIDINEEYLDNMEMALFLALTSQIG